MGETCRELPFGQSRTTVGNQSNHRLLSEGAQPLRRLLGEPCD